MNPAPPVTSTRICGTLDSPRRRGNGASGAPSAPGAFRIPEEEFMAQVESRNRATAREESRSTGAKRIKDEGVDVILRRFTGILGHLKTVAVTPNEIEGALED